MTYLDMPPEKILAAAAKMQFSQVIVIGYEADGSEYFAQSTGDMAELLLLAERYKAHVLTEYDRQLNEPHYPAG